MYIYICKMYIYIYRHKNDIRNPVIVFRIRATCWVESNHSDDLGLVTHVQVKLRLANADPQTQTVQHSNSTKLCVTPQSLAPPSSSNSFCIGLRALIYYRLRVCCWWCILSHHMLLLVWHFVHVRSDTYSSRIIPTFPNIWIPEHHPYIFVPPCLHEVEPVHSQSSMRDVWKLMEIEWFKSNGKLDMQHQNVENNPIMIAIHDSYDYHTIWLMVINDLIQGVLGPMATQRVAPHIAMAGGKPSWISALNALQTSK